MDNVEININDKIKNLIHQIDNEIKTRNLYLQPEHKKGKKMSFDFQKSNVSFKGFEVSPKVINSFIDEKLQLINHSNNTLKDFYLINSNERTWSYDFLNHGVVYTSLFLETKLGKLYHTKYYKNISPETSVASFNVSNATKEQIEWKKVLLHFTGTWQVPMVRSDENQIALACKSMSEKEKQLLTKYNPDAFKKYNDIFVVLAQPIEDKPTWEQLKACLLILFEKVDDSCMNILSRTDIIHYIDKNKEALVSLITELSSEQKKELTLFYNNKKDWFYLLPYALDLKQNPYYKTLANVKQNEELAKKMSDFLQFISLSVGLEFKPVVKKRKI